MPSVKQGGGYTLTFAKKNEDVKELLAAKKKEKGMILTDYICEAVRFYEENKNKIVNNQLGNIDIEELVKKEVSKILNNIQQETEEVISSEEVCDLEGNLDDMDLAED